MRLFHSFERGYSTTKWVKRKKTENTSSIKKKEGRNDKKQEDMLADAG